MGLRRCRQVSLHDLCVIDNTVDGLAARRWRMVRAQRVVSGARAPFLRSSFPLPASRLGVEDGRGIEAVSAPSARRSSRSQAVSRLSVLIKGAASRPLARRVRVSRDGRGR